MASASAGESVAPPAEPPTSVPMEATLVIPAAPPPAAAPAVTFNGNSVWDALADVESGGNWATNTGNGYYGGLQFSSAPGMATAARSSRRIRTSHARPADHRRRAASSGARLSAVAGVPAKLGLP